jgi:hypothetical protein
MLATPTLDKLHALKLPAMAQAWTEQQQNPELAALSFDERLGLVVDAEWLARENKRLTLALQEAKLKLGRLIHFGFPPIAPFAEGLCQIWSTLD